MSQATYDEGDRSTFPPETLVRTETGCKLHIAECPHLGRGLDRVDRRHGGLRIATAAERLAMGVCSWCRAELDGVGRTYCDDLADAMRLFGTHAGTERLIRDALRCVAYDQIWLPNSRTYVALGREGHGVAWFGKTYVVPVAGEFIELPNYHAGLGGGVPEHPEVGQICPDHFLAMSLTGVCDLCD